MNILSALGRPDFCDWDKDGRLEVTFWLLGIGPDLQCPGAECHCFLKKKPGKESLAEMSPLCFVYLLFLFAP